MESKWKHTLSIAIAAFCFGLIPIFGQYLSQNGVSSFKQTFFMEVFAFMLLTPIYFFVIKINLIKKKDFLFFILFGASLYLVNLFPLTSIALGMPVGLVSLLTFSYPAFVLIISRIWFGDQITIKKIIYVSIALIGVGFTLGQGLSEGSITVPGVLTALGGGLSLAFWTCFGRASALKGYKPFDSVFWSEVGAIILLVISIFIIPILFPDPTISSIDFVFNAKTFSLLFALATICVVIGHTLFFYGIGEIKPVKASMIALFEPITAVLLGAILFSQSLSIWTLIGGILILTSSFLINKGD